MNDQPITPESIYADYTSGLECPCRVWRKWDSDEQWCLWHFAGPSGHYQGIHESSERDHKNHFDNRFFIFATREHAWGAFLVHCGKQGFARGLLGSTSDTVRRTRTPGRGYEGLIAVCPVGVRPND